MADVSLTPLTVGRATPANYTDGKTAATATNNYLIANNGNTRLIATSTAGANLTVVTAATLDGLTIADLVIALAAGKTYIIGPFPRTVYGTTLTVLVSAATDIAAVIG